MEAACLRGPDCLNPVSITIFPFSAPQHFGCDPRNLVSGSPQQLVFVCGQHSRSGRGAELAIEQVHGWSGRNVFVSLIQPLGHEYSSGIDQSVLSGEISAIAESTESFMRSRSDICPSRPTGVGGVSSISSGGVQLSQMASINDRGRYVCLRTINTPAEVITKPLCSLEVAISPALGPIQSLIQFPARGQSVKFWAHIRSLNEVDTMLSLLDFPFTICLCA